MLEDCAPPGAGPPLLEARGLSRTFRTGLLRGRRVTALDGVSFTVRRGEAVALVGESGSGKSTVGRLVARLDRPDAGALLLAGEDVLRTEPRRASLAYRARVQLVFQDPFASLNPAHDVLHHLARPLLRHGRATPADVRARALALLALVGLAPPEDFLPRRPHQLSGGQRQRVAIARALAVGPDLLVADEPTSMLDVSIRSGILALLGALVRERGLGLLLVTHDLAAARALADRILVLYRGHLVEEGPAGDVVAAPLHPYTRALLAALSDVAPGAPPRPPEAAPAGACGFLPRCPHAHPACARAPVLAAAGGGDGRRVACHLHLAPQGAPT